MSIYGFCKKFNISVTKARRMQREGFLPLEAEDEAADRIRWYFGRGQDLPVHLLLVLLERPHLILQLGPHESKAECLLKALGDVEGEAAPKEVTAYILDASQGEPESVAIIVAWLRSIIPKQPVSYHWLAMRLIWGVPANIRKYDVTRLPGAFGRCRQHPGLVGWWRIEKEKGRSRSVFQRPIIEFDL